MGWVRNNDGGSSAIDTNATGQAVNVDPLVSEFDEIWAALLPVDRETPTTKTLAFECFKRGKKYSSLVPDLARFMAYAYHRGVLDASGMPDCREKELRIKRLGGEDSEKWIAAANALISMVR